MVDYDHVLSQVTTLYDVAEKKVISFKRSTYCDGSFQSVHRRARFFNTQQEAEAWLSKHRAKLKEQMPKVREFLEEMSNLYSSEDFTFVENDFLPESYRDDDDFYQRRYYYKSKIVDMLSIACRQQTLCINGSSFPLSQVRRINWCRGKAELTLSDGSFGSNSTVSTNSEEELEVVKILFGENTSGFQFKR